MAPQTTKVIAAAAVLATGLAMACFFPATGEAPLPSVAPAGWAPSPLAAVSIGSASAPPLEGNFAPMPPVPAFPAAHRGIDASGSDAPYAGTPIAPPYSVAPTEPANAAGVENARASSAGYRIHVVHDGDTLEQLAERYLGDASLAWELFDLNRDTLANPHVLPLFAELRIPAAAGEE